MKIARVVTGMLSENCYIVSDNNECLVIDPGDNFDLIEKEIGSKKVLKVLITHHHFDHVGALDDIINKYKVDVIDYNYNKSNYEISNFKFDIIRNPGHTSDSISFYFKEDKVMFTGDFLFKESIGRTDLPTGDEQDMYSSIKLIKKYPGDIKIYPGHGDSSTLEYEFKNNYYFNI